MKSKLLERLSFLKIAGKDKFLIINIYREWLHLIYLKSKEPFFRITKSDYIVNYRIVDKQLLKRDDSLSDIKDSINNFINKNNINDALTLIGINEFKLHSIKIPEDVDDIAAWFSENSTKFLPEGQTSADFAYSYEKNFENEDSEFYQVAVARKDYLEKILNACSSNEIIPLGIYPFTLSIASFNSIKNQNTLYIDLLTNKIQIFYNSESGSSYYGEIYQELIDDFYEINDEQLFEQQIEGALKKIKDSISVWLNSTNYSVDKLYINCQAQHFTIIKNIASEIFSTHIINSEFEKEDPSTLGALLTFNKIINNYDSGINLLPDENKNEEREKLEKYISLKLALVTGVAVIFLLLFSNVFKGYLIKEMDQNDEELLMVKDQTKELESLTNERNLLNVNLKLYQNLRGDKRERYSRLLSQLTHITNDNTCLLDLSIKEISSEKIGLEITGCAYNQSDVAEMMHRMETKNTFTEISLRNSEFIETKYISRKLKISDKEIVRFNIMANYNAN